jgi:hypothetical protein
MSNIAAKDLGRVLLRDISHQSVTRHENECGTVLCQTKSCQNSSGHHENKGWGFGGFGFGEWKLNTRAGPAGPRSFWRCSGAHRFFKALVSYMRLQQKELAQAASTVPLVVVSHAISQDATNSGIWHQAKLHNLRLVSSFSFDPLATVCPLSFQVVFTFSEGNRFGGVVPSPAEVG